MSSDMTTLSRALRDFLSNHQEEILSRWERASTVPASPTLVMDEALRERMRKLLAELAMSSPGNGSSGATDISEQASHTQESGDPASFRAYMRGCDRLLCAVLATATAARVDVTHGDQLGLTSQIHAAVGRVFELYLEVEDRRLHRAAHQLRNALGSATMALTLLKARTEFGDDARLAEMLERNLAKLQGLIDTVVDSGHDSSTMSTAAENPGDAR